MATHGYTHASPHRGDGRCRRSRPGHCGRLCERSAHLLPKSGTKRPWNVRQHFFADAIDYRFDRIKEAMVFGARRPGLAARVSRRCWAGMNSY